METRSNAPTRDDWIYLAGLTDGEGCLTINRMSATGAGWSLRYCAAIKIANCDEGLMRWLKHTFGSNYYLTKRTDGTRRVGWQWIASSGKAVHVCTMILPHLRIKHRQAQCLIDVENSALENPAGRRGRRHGIRVPPEEMARRESLYQVIRRLNAKGLSGDEQRLNEGTSLSGEDVIVRSASKDAEVGGNGPPRLAKAG